MDLVLSAPKTILLAVQLAAKADIDSLAFLAEQQSNILHKELLLRILLTYLPKSLETLKYVSFIEKIESGDFTDVQPAQLDLSAVNNLTEEEASRRVRKLRLQQLTWPNSPEQLADDPTSLFLLRRAYAVDEEAGLLDQLPDLLVPFLQRSSYIRRWLVSSLLPLLRRNVEYHPESPLSHTIATFEQLPDRDAVTQLLSQTGMHEPNYQFTGRDLKGMIGPWLLEESRWPNRDPTTPQSSVGKSDFCPGWEQVLQWLTYQAAKSWKVAVSAIEQWDGPSELDLGGYGTMWLEDAEQEYLERRYAQAAIACAYLIPDTSDEALSGAHNIAVKIMSLLDQDPAPPLHTSASLLSPIPELEETDLISVQNAKHLRNDLLKDDNTLTSPTPQSLQLLHGLVLSAFLITRLGVPCTVRRAGELVLLQDEREQRSAAIQLIKHITHNTQKTDDKHWIQMRNEILWLRDWGAEERAETSQCLGVFGQVKKEYLEVEFLKALLANTRYTLAKTLYEDSTDAPLPSKVIQDTVYAAALNAYDNASNPNRTRGGVKKCNDILHSFPRTVDRSLVATQRIEALLKATHTLSNYRLVLKKGEPFTPVVLRVHSDPISIIGKVLEQNAGSYTKIQEFLDLGANMVEAGLTVKDQSGHSTLTAEQEPEQRVISERRVTAMCVDAALEEDDFETAYSYIVNRIAELPSSTQSSRSTLASHIQDEWSWKAALQAGKYRRTERTVRPTHLGTTSGNPEVRHLEQRIECLATALRIAPAATLQEILNSYRRCEEELDAAAKAESEQENAWDDAADRQAMPGTFGTSPGPAGVLTGRAAAASGSSGGRQQLHNAEEAPLSLFDLSRATARLASRNFAALSSLQQSGQTRSGEQPGASHQGGLASGDDDSEHHQRVRKRDQLRDAAMGTLVSGVGWLVGAQPADRGQERE